MEEYQRRFSELKKSSWDQELEKQENKLKLDIRELIAQEQEEKNFFSQIVSNLDNANWLTKRNIIRTLVKRIEINLQDVNVVFRVKELQESSEHKENQNY